MTPSVSVRKILVVALDNIGDAVMATAVLKPLKRLYPHASIGLWVKNYAADLFWDQSLIDAVHVSDPFWDKAPGRGKGALKDFVKTLWELRQARYDLAFVLNSEWRRSIAVALAGIPNRVGFNRRKSKFFLTNRVRAPRETRHFVDDHLDLVHEWSGQPVNRDDCLPRLELNLAEKEAWKKWSQQTGWKEKTFITVHPFTGDDAKTWPLSCWIDLLQALIARQKNLRCLILSGPGEEDRLQRLVSNLPGECVQVSSAGSLSKMKALIGHSSFLMGGDSGPGHVAAALGVPVISLFGTSDPARSRPLGHVPITILKKNPLRELLVSEVEEQVRSFLEEKQVHA